MTHSVWRWWTVYYPFIKCGPFDVVWSFITETDCVVVSSSSSSSSSVKSCKSWCVMWSFESSCVFHLFAVYNSIFLCQYSIYTLKSPCVVPSGSLLWYVFACSSRRVWRNGVFHLLLCADSLIHTRTLIHIPTQICAFCLDYCLPPLPLMVTLCTPYLIYTFCFHDVRLVCVWNCMQRSGCLYATTNTVKTCVVVHVQVANP